MIFLFRFPQFRFKLGLKDVVPFFWILDEKIAKKNLKSKSKQNFKSLTRVPFGFGFS